MLSGLPEEVQEKGPAKTRDLLLAATVSQTAGRRTGTSPGGD